jgi:5-methylcytosine-specific restriction protein A
MKFTDKTRELIRYRASGRCEKCGGMLKDGGQIHHRKARGMGGTKDLRSRSAANGLLMHAGCHAAVESNREEAYRRGWLVHSWQESDQVPVLRGHEWLYLRDDGSVELGE